MPRTIERRGGETRDPRANHPAGRALAAGGVRQAGGRAEPGGRQAGGRQAGGWQAGGRAGGRRRAPKGYLALLGLVCVVNLVGLVMVLSASSVQAQRAYGNPWYFFERQLLWMTLGALALWAGARIDYHRLRAFSAPLMAFALLLLFAVLVPGVGLSANGSTRWLGLGSWRVQPSELAKLAIVLFAADLLTRRASHMDDIVSTFVPVMAAFGVTGVMVMMQPDMGTTLVIFTITLSLVFVAGTPMVTIGKSLLTAGVLSFLLGMVQPYRRDRLLTFLHPFKDAGNTGYQIVQSYVSLGSGGLFGRGLGSGIEKWGYLPNPYTDFIFAVIGEETGLLGTLVVVLLFAGFALLGVRAAVRAPDRFGTLLATGVTAWIVSQAVLNMGAVIGLLPVTGVPLPFVSFGGSSLVITMGAVGILASVARQER